MTDPLAPLTDEDLSAVLDGEADASVVARVDADPAASARLAQLRTASDALRSAPVAPLAPAIVDDLIGRALAAADEVPAPGDGVVQPMVAPTRRRNGAMPPWLVAAAVVLLVGVGLVLVWSGRDRSSNQQDAAVNTEQTTTAVRASDSAEASPGAGADRPDRSAAVPSSPHGVPTTVITGDPSSQTPDGLTSLGTFADADALREGLKSSFPRRSPTSDPDRLDQQGLTAATISRCDTQVRTILSIEDQARNEGVATVDGRQVLVYEYPTTTDDGRKTTLVTAVYPAACDQVLTFIR